MQALTCNKKPYTLNKARDHAAVFASPKAFCSQHNGLALEAANLTSTAMSGAGSDTLHGSHAQDLLVDGGDQEIICGNDGDDSLYGSGLDWLHVDIFVPGDSSDDTIYGGDSGRWRRYH